MPPQNNNHIAIVALAMIHMYNVIDLCYHQKSLSIRALTQGHVSQPNTIFDTTSNSA